MPITLLSDSTMIHKIFHVNDQFVFCAVPSVVRSRGSPAPNIQTDICSFTIIRFVPAPASLPRSVMCSSLTTIYNVIHHPLSVLRSRVTWSVVSQDLSVHIPNIPTAGHHGMDITVCGREGPLQEWCPLFTILTAEGFFRSQPPAV